jgi:hypothetical protein
MGMPGEISSEAVGRGQTRTFPNKNQAESRSETKPNRISNGHATLLHQSNWGDRPSGTEELKQKLRKQWNGMTLNCQSGEAIRDDDGKIAGAGLKLHNGIRV